MDRTTLSAGIIAEMGRIVEETLRRALPALLAQTELGALEQQVQELSRMVWGRLVEQVLAAQAAATVRPARCGQCQGRVRRRERTRVVQGMVGEYRVQRPTSWCARCGHSEAPLDTQAGLGRGQLSPALARVVARAAIEAPFAQAVDVVAEALGVAVDAEVARRTTEEIGAVVEAQHQAHQIQRAQHQEPVWPAESGAPAADTAILMVAVDGVQVHRDGAWHELKVGTLAPLGPNLDVDPATGRTHLVWGAASYVGEVADAEACWWRVYSEAVRRGLGTAAVRTVVVLGDGAHWIWERAAPFVGVAGVEVIEIVDIYHAYGYLWAVAEALYGTGTALTSACAHRLKDLLYTHGASAVLPVLAALTPPTPEAADVLTTAQHYLATHAARMDYPRFVARQFPIGSGAVESACTTLIAARMKEAGMRGHTPGLQALVSLRALHRSGGWAALWRRSPLVVPHAPPPRRSSLPRQDVEIPLPAATPPPLPTAPLPRPSTPRPHQRPLVLPRSA